MRVLVTGGGGWIGRATVKALTQRGHEAVTFDRTHDNDITDAAEVEGAIKAVDHVIHLAGVLGTHELFEDPMVAVSVNVGGSLNITVACARHDVGLTEITMPRVNPSLYAATKACAMDIALAYHKSFDLRCSFVRAYNAYGPGQAFGDGHPQKILPTFATRAWAGKPLPVWGSGDLMTDLVHVDDIARVLVEAMDYENGQCFDAGTGYGQPVNRVAQMVIDHVGSAGGPISTIQHLAPRKGERAVSTPDDVARGENWSLLGGWRPVFDPQRFVEAIDSYRGKV